MYLRYGVRAAGTWRIVSELLRRHHANCGLRVLETHPGGGQYDCLTLACSRDGNPFAQHLCDFNVASQHLHVWKPFHEPRGRLEDLRWPDGNDYVLQFLAADDPKRVVDQIEGMLGLPAAPSPVPPTSPATLVARVIAAVTERHAFSRSVVQARCCWHDSNGMDGSYIEPWIACFPDLKRRIDALPATAQWTDVAQVAGRLWRLSLVGQEDAVLLDMGTGQAIRASAAKDAMPLWDMYQHSGRRVSLLADWVEQRLLAV